MHPSGPGSFFPKVIFISPFCKDWPVCQSYIIYPLAVNHAQAEGVHLQMVKVNMNRKFAFGSDETDMYIARLMEEQWESGASGEGAGEGDGNEAGSK